MSSVSINPPYLTLHPAIVPDSIDTSGAGSPPDFTLYAPYLIVPVVAPTATPSRYALDITAFVARWGSLVYINNGLTPGLCIPDEDYTKINQFIRAMNIADYPEGRTVLFNFAPGSPLPATEIKSVTWDGQIYAIFPARAVGASDVRVMQTVMGIAGGVVFG